MLNVAGSVISDDPEHLVRSGINFIYACGLAQVSTAPLLLQ